MLTETNLEKKTFKYWWLSLIVGIMSMVAGICCFVTPVSSIVALTTLFMVVLILGGIFNIVSAIMKRQWNHYWGWDLTRGIIEVLFGIWLFMLPTSLVTTTLVYVFGFWMMFHSIIGICESCELAGFPLKGWGWLLFFNILSLLCSFIFLISPIYGGIFILVYVGISFMLYGIFRIVLAFQFRKLSKVLQ